MRITKYVLSILLVLGFLLVPAAALAATVHCAYHPMAMCYGTGQIRYIGGSPYEKYHCTCGDEVWVKQ